ncbi:type II and III secretion system protein family protein [Rhizobium ruizarguesonis]
MTALNIVRNDHSGEDWRGIVIDTPKSVVFACLRHFLCAGILLSQLSAVAQTKQDDSGGTSHASPNSISGTLNLSSSLGKTIHLSAPAASIFVADPTIADYQAPSNKTIFAFGKKSGRTTLFALDENGEALAQLQIVVAQPIDDLRAMLRARTGDYPIHVSYTPRGAVLSGTAPNAEVVDTAMKITEQFLGAGAQIVNKIQVTGSLQVNLSVRVAEVSRSALKKLGVNLSAFGQISNFKAGLLSSGNEAGFNSGNNAGIRFSGGNSNASAVLDALATEHLASVLAEPNLTAMSGESASFLAGGVFPIPVVQNNGQASVEFRSFGVSLEFVPTVLSNNQINIRVKPEASELSSQGAVQMNGFSVPAISTRRADTVVELASGQSFAIGGLIRRSVNTDISAFPWLGDVPVLGALFRSSSYQKEETELVIIVTPYIVRPGSSPSQMSVPTDRIEPPLGVGSTPKNSLASPPPARGDPHTGLSRPAGGAGFIIE